MSRAGRKRRAAAEHRGRIRLLAVLLIGLLGVAAARAIHLQVYRAQGLRERANDQYARKLTILPERGKILDRNREELAASVPGASAFATSSKLLEDPTTFSRVCGVLELSEKRTAKRLRSRGEAFTWLKRHISPMQEEELRALGSDHVGIAPEPVRFYPKKALAGQVLGFVGTDGHGLGGLEYRYDELLRGRELRLNVERDARAGQLMARAPDAEDVRGHTLVLTLDQTVQHIVEDELVRTVRAHEAKGGFAVVMEPDTGAILAMAQVPRLNSNEFGDAREVDRKNRNVTDVFEPGSTLKTLFMALLLDKGKAKPGETVFCENGQWRIHDRVIHDHVEHGSLSLADILMVSSNIGVAKLANRLSPEEFYAGYRKFGLGEASGVNLSGESRGLLPAPKRWSKVTPMTLSYGQGVSVTPVQLTRALAALGNGGVMMRPYIVREIIAPDGTPVERIQPQVTGRAVSEETARTLLGWMKRVVHDEEGTGALVDGSGYSVAGKTGTAWKVVGGSYDRKKVVASFMGVAPADRPRVAILVAVDEPRKGSRYGGMVAGPAFREIVRRTLNHLGVPPDRPDVARPAASAKPRKAPSRTQTAQVTPGRMPELRGVTMREALRRLEHTGVGLQLELEGSGLAYRQEPAPGVALEPGTFCRVAFESPFAADAAIQPGNR